MRLSKKQIQRMKIVLLGGEGSGNFDHAGRPGKVGGSQEKLTDKEEPPKKFRDMLDINQWTEKNKSSLFPETLEKVEKETLDNYKRNIEVYKPLNSYLRKGKIEDENYGFWEDESNLKKGINFIDSAISKSEIPESIVVYRGLPSEILPKGTQEFTDNGFGSVTMDYATGHKFARWVREYNLTPALVEIKVPKGYKGVAMDFLWDNAEEEILLKRGTKYKILRDYEKPAFGGSIRFIEAEVIP